MGPSTAPIIIAHGTKQTGQAICRNGRARPKARLHAACYAKCTGQGREHGNDDFEQEFPVGVFHFV